MEADLWLVDNETPTDCYSAWYSPIDNDPWKIMIPRDSYLTGQTEAAWIMKAYGGTLQVWVTLWDDGTIYPASTRITGSGLQVKVYKNNVLVKTLNVPSTPTTANSNAWYVGKISLSTNAWTTVNQIKTDAQLPACIITP